MNRTVRPNLPNGKTKLSPTTKTKWRKATARRWASAEAEAEAIIDQISLESGSSSDDDKLRTPDRSPKKISTLDINESSPTNLYQRCGVRSTHDKLVAHPSPKTLEPFAEETSCQQSSEALSRFLFQIKG
jgi:hypothetical protein